jgi:hypothetical protein
VSRDAQSAHASTPKIDAGKVATLQLGSHELGVGEVGEGEVRAGQLKSDEVFALEVEVGVGLDRLGSGEDPWRT